jgi:hypothetical protein
LTHRDNRHAAQKNNISHGNRSDISKALQYSTLGTLIEWFRINFDLEIGKCHVPPEIDLDERRGKRETSWEISSDGWWCHVQRKNYVPIVKSSPELLFLG